MRGQGSLAGEAGYMLEPKQQKTRFIRSLSNPGLCPVTPPWCLVLFPWLEACALTRPLVWWSKDALTFERAIDNQLVSFPGGFRGRIQNVSFRDMLSGLVSVYLRAFHLLIHISLRSLCRYVCAWKADWHIS